MRFFYLLLSKASGVGHDIEKIILFLKSAEDAFMVPSGVHGNTVYSLDPQRVVINDNDLFAVPYDLFPEQPAGASPEDPQEQRPRPCR